ncbi:MAG TPA: acyltransferase family protein [Eoetvoesiella sp.]
MIYRREIDGLRAVAILPVVFFHAGLTVFSGGYFGVDIFFVISGYLITSIILGQKKSGTFSFLNFYERRARRIFPALFFMILVCFVFAWLWMMPSDLKQFSQSVIAATSFSSNFFFWQHSGYFDMAAELNPLLHTWSLAIEEQFYLIFPIFIVVMWPFKRLWMYGLLLAGGVASLVLAQWTAFNMPSAGFYLLPTRVWELLAGVFAAFYLSRASHQHERASAADGALGLLGLVLIAIAVFFFDDDVKHPGFTTLVPVVGALLIILFATPQNLAGKLLGNKALVGVGLISYSLYLWHQPLLAFAKIRFGSEIGDSDFIALILLSFVLAYVSWRFIEQPFRNRKAFSQAKIFSFSTGFCVLFLSVGSLGHLTNGFNDLIRGALSAEENAILSIIEAHASGSVANSINPSQCVFNTNKINADFVDSFKKCKELHGPAVLVVGDSHAEDMFGAFYHSNLYQFMIGLTSGGCRPGEDLSDTCFYPELKQFVAAHGTDIKTIFFNQAGYELLINEDGEQVDKNMLRKRDVSDFRLNLPSAQTVAGYLNELSKATKVVWLGPYIEPHVSFSNVTNLIESQFAVRPEISSTFTRLDSDLMDALEQPEYSFEYVSLVENFKFGTATHLKMDDCITFHDSDHMSACGEKIFGERLKSLQGHVLATAG